MPRLAATFLVLSLVLFVGQPATLDADATGGPRLVLVGRWDSGQKGGTEVLSVQASTHRMAVTQRNSPPAVVILDIKDPAQPKELRRLPVPDSKTEEMTSVAFHPTEDHVLVALNDKSATKRGRVLILSATSGEIVAEHPVGHGPDHVVVSPQGDTAIVANEAEQCWYDVKTNTIRSMPGGFSIIDLCNGCERSTVDTRTLDEVPACEGLIDPAHKRCCERAVDLNVDGIIDPNEEGVEVPLGDSGAEHLEPEYAAYSPDGSRAYITMQENNAVLVVDPRERKVITVFSLGTTCHACDRDDDGKVEFDDELVALREPDGIGVTPDGKYFVTADEGDTEPKASKTPKGMPTGGGRTVSVFDAQTGKFLGDTANQLDELAHARGIYPDKRSDSKGSEPENLVVFATNGKTFVAVGLERASGVALIDISVPSTLRVIDVYPLAKGSIAPEGLAYHRSSDGRMWVYSANEVSGDVSVFQFHAK